MKKANPLFIFMLGGISIKITINDTIPHGTEMILQKFPHNVLSKIFTFIKSPQFALYDTTKFQRIQYLVQIYAFVRLVFLHKIKKLEFITVIGKQFIRALSVFPVPAASLPVKCCLCSA